MPFYEVFKISGEVSILSLCKAASLMKSLFFILIAFSMIDSAIAQDQNPLVLTEDARYFDFWEGKWIALRDNNTLDSTVSFEVVRSVNPASFEERWQFGIRGRWQYVPGTNPIVRGGLFGSVTTVFIRPGTPARSTGIGISTKSLT